MHALLRCDDVKCHFGDRSCASDPLSHSSACWEWCAPPAASTWCQWPTRPRPVFQQPKPQTVEEIFAGAAKEMELRFDGGPPFELHAKFSIKEGDNVVSTGTYRELWRSLTTWRRDITFESTRVTMACDNTSFSGEGLEERMLYESSSLIRNLLPSFLAHPDDKRWTLAPARIDGNLLTRAQMDYPATACAPASRIAALYFTPGTVHLRAVQEGDLSVVFNDFQPLGSKLVPRKVSIMLPPNKEIDVEIDSITLPATLNETSFVLPKGPKKKCGNMGMALSTGVIRGPLIKPIVPVFPPQARAEYQERLVNVRVTIGKDGVPKNVSVVEPSYPSARSGVFSRPAIEAVKEARWQPSLLLGEPVEVTTDVVVDFK